MNDIFKSDDVSYIGLCLNVEFCHLSLHQNRHRSGDFSAECVFKANWLGIKSTPE